MVSRKSDLDEKDVKNFIKVDFFDETCDVPSKFKDPFNFKLETLTNEYNIRLSNLSSELETTKLKLSKLQCLDKTQL